MHHLKQSQHRKMPKTSSGCLPPIQESYIYTVFMLYRILLNYHSMKGHICYLFDIKYIVYIYYIYCRKRHVGEIVHKLYINNLFGSRQEKRFVRCQLDLLFVVLVTQN